MTETFLQINDVFNWRDQSFRLLAFTAEGLCVIPMDAKNPLPKIWPVSKLSQAKGLDGSRVPDQPSVSASALSLESNIAVRDRSWERIKGIIEDTGLFEKKLRGGILCEHAKKIGVSKKTLLHDLRNWWLGGQIKDALIGQYDQCGRIDSSTEGSQVVTVKGQSGNTLSIFAPSKGRARGRRPLYGEYEPYLITPDMRLKFIGMGEEIYNKDASVSVRALTDKVLAKFFAYRDEKGELLTDEACHKALLPPRGQRPSEDQIRKLLNKAFAISTRRAKRESPSDYKNNHAPKTGSVLDDCRGPGDVFEIDATFIDLWIVALADDTKIIGKATLYLVIDRASRLIVGFYISLENPSWGEAKMAILSIAADKRALCKRLGVKYNPEDWVADGILAARFVGDRGEMISFASNQLCDGADVSITNPPSRHARDKAIVESGFKVVHVPMKDNVPGYEPPKNARSRSGKHYDKDACMNLDQLAKIFLQIVIKHNNTPKAGYPVTPEEVFSGFVPTPIAIWNRAVQNRMGLGKRYAYNYLAAKLARTAKATVTDGGIEFKGCSYKFDEALYADWHTRASLHGVFDVDVTYTENLVDNITIQDPRDKTKAYTGSLASKSEKFLGYSFAEVKAYHRALSGSKKKDEDHNQAARILLGEEMDKTTLPAHSAMKESTKGMKLGTRHADSLAVRKAEQAVRRQAAHDQNGDGTPYLELPQSASPDDASATDNVRSIHSARKPQATSKVEPAAHSIPSTPQTTMSPDFAQNLFNFFDTP